MKSNLKIIGAENPTGTVNKYRIPGIKMQLTSSFGA